MTRLFQTSPWPRERTSPSPSPLPSPAGRGSLGFSAGTKLARRSGPGWNPIPPLPAGEGRGEGERLTTLLERGLRGRVSGRFQASSAATRLALARNPTRTWGAHASRVPVRASRLNFRSTLFRRRMEQGNVRDEVLGATPRTTRQRRVLPETWRGGRSLFRNSGLVAVASAPLRPPATFAPLRSPCRPQCFNCPRRRHSSFPA